MQISGYYPYRSEAARDACFAYLDSLAAREWPVASDNRLIPTSYGATFVRASGPKTAPPLVLLHGAAATSLMWVPNIQALSTECRTFAVDQVGEFGKSTCAKQVRSLSDLVAWLNELLEALEPGGRVNLAGMSYGGALVAQYALHFPGKLNKIVLLAPGATVQRTSAEFWVRVIWVAINNRRGLPPFLRWVFADMVRKDPKWVEGTIEQAILNFRSLQRHITPIPPVLSDAEWARLKVPALFLVGAHDVIYSPEKAVARLRRVAPAITAEIVPGAGHDFTVAEAAAVNQRILEFLR